MSAVIKAIDQLSQRVEAGLGNCFSWIGRKVASNALLSLAIPIAITAILAGLIPSQWQLEANPEKLYTPQDALAFEHQEFAEDVFGFDPRLNTIVVESSNQNNLVTQEGLLEFQRLFEENLESFSIVYKGTTYTYNDLCEPVSCQRQSVLDVYNYNRTEIESDPTLQRLRAESDETLRNSIGNFQRTGDVITGQAFRMLFFLQNERVEISGGSNDDPIAAEFEIKVYDEIVSFQSTLFDVYASTEGYFNEESDRAITSDIGLLTIGYTLIFIYSTIVYARNSAVYSKSMLGLVGIISILLSIAATIGLCLVLQIKFNLVVQTLAVVLLGIGLDDGFVITSAYMQEPKSLDIVERMAAALKHAGSSITVTSITDFAAFLTATSSRLPALRDFAIYAAVGVFFDFAFQVTFFVAGFVIDLRRQRAGRVDVLCCLKVPEERQTQRCCGSTSFDETEEPFSQQLIGKYLPKVVLNPIGKIVILIMSAGLLGSMAYTFTLVDSDFDIEWFIPSNSDLQDYFTVRDRYFTSELIPFSAYTRNGDYFEQRQELVTMASDLQQVPQYVSSLTSWYDEFVLARNSSDFTNSTQFYSDLSTYLDTSGARFAGDVKWNNNVTRDFVIASRMTGQFLVQSDSDGDVASMKELRRICLQAAPSFDAFAYSFPYLFFEGYAVIAEDTVRNVFVALGAVFVICLLLLANLEITFIITFLIAAIDVVLFGSLYLLGLTFDSVVSINLILAVGLSVDACAHLAHSFMVAHADTKDERARIALRRIGGSVFNGGVTTFLAVAPLALANSYIFRTFFKMFAMIVLFSQWHGLFLLPVLLSYIGPPSYTQIRQRLADSRDASNTNKAAPIEMDEPIKQQ